MYAYAQPTYIHFVYVFLRVHELSCVNDNYMCVHLCLCITTCMDEYFYLFFSYLRFVKKCVGRTGRAGKSGDAFTFVSRSDATKTLRDLIDIMNRANQIIPPELHAICSYGNNGGYNSGYRRGRGGYRGGRGGYSSNHYGSRGASSGYGNRYRGGYSGSGAYQPFNPTSMGGEGAGAAYGANMHMQNYHAGATSHPASLPPQSSYHTRSTHAECTSAPTAQAESFHPY